MRWSKLFRLPYIKGVHKYSLKSLLIKRMSSNFKRPTISTHSEQLLDIRHQFFDNHTELASSDWQTVTELLLKNYKHVNKNNVEAIIVGICNEYKQLSLAKSFTNHLKSIGKQPNDATLGKLLRIYNASYHDARRANNALPKEEQEEILKIYKQLKVKHEILDHTSCENLICGLVATKEWKICLDLLEMMKLYNNTPSALAYTEIIIKSFATNELQLGWHLMEEMLEQGKPPKCEIFLTLINTILKKHMNNFCNEFEKLLNFLETYNILLTKDVINILLEVASKHPNYLKATPSNLTHFGKCLSCGLHMKNISLSDNDFKILQDSFLDKVLLGNDVFQKSSPLEVKQFCDYIERTGPFDCVVDGLNVAYSMGSKKPTHTFANLLASVVKYFRNKDKHILVLGRKHMNNWPKKSMRYIKDNAAIFLANDISQDDPFLLYATLKSGQMTDFFSRDLMRQHAFLLGPKLNENFRRWQQEHQYSLITQTESGKIIVKEPIRHMICAHKVQDMWHVPCKKEFSTHIDGFEKPEQWLCIKLLK